MSRTPEQPAEPAAKDKRRRGERAAKASNVQVLLAKARVLAGDSVDERQALEVIASRRQFWGEQGAVQAPYDPESLIMYREMSPHLTPCIDAYATNIDGYGNEFKPVQAWMGEIDSEVATNAIREAILIERWVDEEEARLSSEVEEKARKRRRRCKADATVEPPTPVDDVPGQEGGRPTEEASPGMPTDQESPQAGATDQEVPDAEIDARREEIRQRLRREQYLAQAWFGNCCSESSFVRLRRDVRDDYETHGWGCIEILRDAYGRPKRLGYIPAYTVRPIVDEGDSVEVTEDDSVTPLSEGREIRVKRKFRRYIQEVDSECTYFKTLGDPRLVSAATGKVYVDDEGEGGKLAEDLFREAEPDGRPANELLWIAQHSARTPCPPPRWIGNLLAVLGTREADEMNYNYFANRSIPPALLFVSGGKIPRDVKDRIESRIRNEIRGVDNAHKILVVEAQVGSPKGTAPGERSLLPQMTFQQLGDTHTDAAFQQYDVRSADRVGASFRLSPILRGLTNSNMNRATADAATFQGEQQVFAPERADFDWIINKHLMPELGIRYLQFVSKTTPTSSPDTTIQLISAAGQQGGLSPNDVREIASAVLNQPLARVDEEWANKPIQMTLAGQAPQNGMAAGQAPEAVGSVAARLRAIEMRIESVVAQELRTAGYDLQLAARFVEPPPREGA